ncbi:MAG: NB-ARC domain-containing protein [Ardenticatenaceae bacterium]|nr:NB-ARC domain-containing protein [Ardenticatenaceae bacterium]
MNDSNKAEDILLFEMIVQHFNLQELKELCFKLDIIFDNLPNHETLNGAAQALVEYMRRRDRTLILRKACYEERPNVTSWGQFSVAKLDIALYHESGHIRKPEKLLGRQPLIKEVIELLFTANRVLLHGLAGIGKTAIASTISDLWLAQGNGSVVWIETGYADSETILDELVNALDLTKYHKDIPHLVGDAKLLAIRESLTKVPFTLYIFDDIWNVDFPIVLEAFPEDLPVLATSRWDLAKLELKWVEVLPPVEALSVLSFYAEWNYKFDETAKTLCQLLDYHPFALEIAGRLLKKRKTPAQLLKQIGENPASRLVLPGGKNFAALLDESAKTLESPADKIFLAIGTLFSPKTTPELLSACTSYSENEVLASLEALAERGLAHQPKVSNTEYFYYELHGLTFNYIKMKHESQGQSDTKPHDYQDTLEAIKTYVEKNATNYILLAFDQSNILAAVEKARELDLWSILYSIVVTLTTKGFVDVVGYSKTFLELLEFVVNTLRKSEDQQEILHHALGKLGNGYFAHGNFDDAYQVYLASLRLSPDQKRKAMLLAVLGKTVFMLDENELAEKYFSDAQKLAETFEDKTTLGFVLQQMSYIAGIKNDFQAAYQHALAAYEVSQQLNNPIRLATALINLGSAESMLAMHEALKRHMEAYKVAEETGHKSLIAGAAYAVATDYHALSDYHAALAYFEEAFTLYQEIGYKTQEQEVITFMNQFGYVIRKRTDLL